MAIDYGIGPYDPCPCGSGKKYKFCCAAKAKANRHGKFPIGTIAYYGPDDKTVTKIAAGVVLSDFVEPIVERWMGTDVKQDLKVAEEIKRFFARYGVKSAVVTDGVTGCPHEEGKDFPAGTECPFCPFWAGKQGIRVRAQTPPLALEGAGDDDGPVKFEMVGEDEVDGDGSEDSFDEENQEKEDAIERVAAIVGSDEEDRWQAIDKILAHLQAHLQLPCEVTGSEDFQWEEPYVMGGWSPAEYKRLRKSQPSYEDRFQLLSISHEGDSEWMMFGDEDICARVRRVSDDKVFTLGLAELEATDKESNNYQLLFDYAVWFVNTR